MTAAPHSPSVEKIAEALWDSTPTRCEVSWKEATTLFKDNKEWQRSVAEHRKGALLACHADELVAILRRLTAPYTGDPDGEPLDAIIGDADNLLAKLDAASTEVRS